MSRDVHLLLGEAKRRGWTVSRTGGGCWRLQHPTGGGIAIATRLPRWVDAEPQLRRIEGTNTSMIENT